MNDEMQVQTVDAFNRHFDRYRNEIMGELKIVQEFEECTKDILIVAHNQLKYLKVCIESVQENTHNYHLYIWNNGSAPDVEEYLNTLMMSFPGKIDVLHSEENIGFILPNNALAKFGDGEYIILLNSDTKVFQGWEKGLIGYLQKHQETAQVGYLGGVLSEEGKGIGWGFGDKLDYLPGWCFCISRATYKKFGLFNEKDLLFAYCEDSDFSLRLREAGKQIYSLHLMLVHHYENKTILAVRDEGRIDVAKSFEHNHEYMKRRWKDYLQTQRIDRKEPENVVDVKGASVSG